MIANLWYNIYGKLYIGGLKMDKLFKRVIKVTNLVLIFCFLCIILNNKVYAAEYSLTPHLNSSTYSSSNFFTKAGNKGGCTWLTWGRTLEKLNIKLTKEFCGNAISWWDKNSSLKKYSYGTEPRSNSIAVWAGGKDGCGHVAFVEKVEGNVVSFNEADFSKSKNYDGALECLTKEQMKKRGTLYLKGYIYLSSTVSPRITPTTYSYANRKVTVEGGQVNSKAKYTSTSVQASLPRYKVYQRKGNVWTKIKESKNLFKAIKYAKGYEHTKVVGNTGKVIWSNYGVINNHNSNISLGSLSAKYESNGKPGIIGNTSGDYGGKSYGAWQFSANMGSLQNFMKWLSRNNTDFYKQLVAAKKLDGGKFGSNFDKKWRMIARNNNTKFLKLQHGYTKHSYYDNTVAQLKKTYRIDINTRSNALRNVLWSTAVQHGVTGAYNIFKKFNLAASDESIINSIYNERLKVNTYFRNCSASIKQSVKNRFINERRDALAMLKMG
jgi:hypothetical protein